MSSDTKLRHQAATPDRKLGLLSPSGGMIRFKKASDGEDFGRTLWRLSLFYQYVKKIFRDLTQIKVRLMERGHTPCKIKEDTHMDVAKQKQLLLDRRKELVGHMEMVEHELDRTPTKDLEDFSTERQGDEVLEALGQAELNEVKRIDAALARVDAGEYGICLDCGNEISAARLEVLPDTALCRHCAARVS